MKALVSLAVLALVLCGCATQRQVAQLKGHGSRQVFRAPFDQVWRAAVDAAQMGELEIVNADRNTGYIASRRGIQVETFGENVGIWVSRLSPTETEVNVVSRQAGPPKFYLKNWEHEILTTIAANLTREAVGASATVPSGTVTSTEVREQNLQDTERRIKELRRQEEVKHDALLLEQSDRRREQINREIDEIRSELNRLQNRLSDLQREQNSLR
jgi:hypothetical protein